MKRYILLEESDEGGGGGIGGSIGAGFIIVLDIIISFNLKYIAAILTGIAIAILAIVMIVLIFLKQFKNSVRLLATISIVLGSYAVCFDFRWLIVTVALGILAMVLKIAVEGPTPITKRIFEVLLWLEALSLVYAFLKDYWWAIPCVIIGILMFIVWLIQKAIEKKEAKLEAKARAKLLDKYKNNPRAITIAQNMVEHFIKEIENAPRDSKTQKISVCEDETAYFKGSGLIRDVQISGIDFEKENLKPIEFESQLIDFMDAIAANAEEFFKKTYVSTHPKDISGTEYTFQTEKKRGNDGYEFNRYRITLTYKAPNGYYKAPEAPKEWL